MGNARVSAEREDSTPNFWRIHCHTGHHPGQWLYWFKSQCCAVGWPPDKWTLGVRAPNDRDWTVTQNALKRMKSGDWIIATLPGNRVGRLGQITELLVEDHQWNPIVPKRAGLPMGENGRRILVRWDLECGPSDPGIVVQLPRSARLNSGELRGTVRNLPPSKLDALRQAMKDSQNWVSLAGSFAVEKALSDYIAIHPHRVEAGLISHPSLDVRELTFSDKTRADVLLQDKDERIVIVECKQNTATMSAIEQLCGYRRKLSVEESIPQKNIRTMLVHGGAHKASPKVNAEAKKQGVELVCFELQVNFYGTT